MAKVENLPLIREAMELTTPITVHTKHGDVPGDVGDVLMKTPGGGELYVIKRVLFKRAYKAEVPGYAISFADAVAEPEWELCRRYGFDTQFDLGDAAEEGDELAQAIVALSRRLVYRDYIRVTFVPDGGGASATGWVKK